MRHVALICSAALLVSLTACSRQTVRHAMREVDKLSDQLQKPKESALPAEPPQPTPPAKPAKSASHTKKPPPEPEPEPTQEELVDYLHGKLLSLSPDDGFNDNVEVRFDPATSVLTIIQPDSRCNHFLNALDANNVSWDIFDPSDSHHTREQLLRLTITAAGGKAARACFDKKGQPEEGAATNRARLLFSLQKAQDVPGFQDRMSKVVKKLVVLCGGAPENEIYRDPHDKAGSKKK